MPDSTGAHCDFIRCRNCGAIMTGTIVDGTIVPVGVEKSGTCGDGDFERLGTPDAGAAGGRPSTASSGE